METAKIILKYEGAEDVILDTRVSLPLFSAMTYLAQIKEARGLVVLHVLSPDGPPQWPDKVLLPPLIHSVQITGTLS